MKLLMAMLVVLSTVAFSQELNCKVIMNLDNIAISNRDLLSGFDRAVSDYMNKTRFSNSDWPNDKINCGLNILMLTATNDGNFSAQVVVTSERPVYQSEKNLQVLRLNDPVWSFTYQKGQGLFSNQSTFDPLSGFLDYYAYLIIGFNEDSWDEFGGTTYFNKAFNIDNLAVNSNFSKGWVRGSGLYSRQALIEDILNDKYRPFREAYFQYYYGIDYYVNVDKKEGQEKIAATMKTLLSMQNKIDFASVVFRTFFDANSGEIINYLKDYPDKNIFKILKQIDPSHSAKYDAILVSN